MYIYIYIWQVPKKLDMIDDYLRPLQSGLKDVWADADMPEVCQYLYGNKATEIPEEIKQYLPRWL